MSTTGWVILVTLCVVWPAALVVGVSALLAFSQGGWRSFAARYPAVPVAMGAPSKTGTLALGGAARYKNCVRFTADAGHLHIRFWPVVLFHPPASVPWADIAGATTHTNWGRLGSIEAGGNTVYVSRRVIDALLADRVYVDREKEIAA